MRRDTRQALRSRGVFVNAPWREVKVTARLGSVYRYFGKLVLVRSDISVSIFIEISIFLTTLVCCVVVCVCGVCVCECCVCVCVCV